MVKELNPSFPIVLLIVLFLMINQHMSMISEINFVQYSLVDDKMYYLSCEYDYAVSSKSCRYRRLGIGEILINLYVDCGVKNIQNKLSIGENNIGRFSYEQNTIYYKMGKDNLLNELMNFSGIEGGAVVQDGLPRELRLEIIDWGPKGPFYIGNYFRDYFNVFVRIKNTESSSVCISRLLLVDWSPKDLLEDIQLNCQNDFKILDPGEEMQIRHCGAFRYLKPGCVNLVFSVDSCGGSISFKENACSCLDAITIRVVKEVVIQILTRDEKVIDKECVTETMKGSLLYKIDETIKMLSVEETLRAYRYDQAKILKKILYCLFMILIICIVILVYKIYSFNESENIRKKKNN